MANEIKTFKHHHFLHPLSSLCANKECLSWITLFCWNISQLKCLSEMLQNLPYFWNTKCYAGFIPHFSFNMQSYFFQKMWQIFRQYFGALSDSYKTSYLGRVWKTFSVSWILRQQIKLRRYTYKSKQVLLSK